MTRMDPRIAQRRAQVAEGRIRRGLVRLLVVLVVVALGAIAVWVLRSPMLQVEEVVIRGVERSAASSALRSAGVVEGIPLISVDVEAVEEELERDPWVREATVGRRWPRRVVVEVEERRPVAWVLTSAGWRNVAADGTPLESAEEPPSAAAVIRLGDRAPGALATDDVALGSLVFVETLSAEVATVTEVYTQDGELQATVGEYWVRLGHHRQMVEKARALEAVLDSDPEPGSVITVIAPTRPAVLPPGAEPEPGGDEEGEDQETSGDDGGG